MLKLTHLRVITLMILAMLVLPGCGEDMPEVAGVGGGLAVWLDQPPDGSSLPVESFTLKAHARDVGGPGVQQIVFFVNTIPLAAVDTDPAQPLAYAEAPWNPAVPGVYLIQAQAINASGSVFSDTARVCVGDECTERLIAEVTGEPSETLTPTITDTPEPGITPSITPTFTLTPTRRPTNPPTTRPSLVPTVPTNTPTPVICSMSAPSPSSPPNGGTVAEPYPSLSWTYSSNDCQPHGYRIDICYDSGCGSIQQSGGTGNPSTSWGPGQPLADCTTYYWRVAGVITQGDTTVLGPYSPVWSFSTAFPNGCGAPPPPADTEAPFIRVPNKPQYSAYGNYCSLETSTLTIYADARDNVGVTSVTFWWRYWNGDNKTTSQWLNKPMTSQGGTSWMVQVNHNEYPEAYRTMQGSYGTLEFQISAFDAAGNEGTFNDHTIQMQVCIG